VAGDGFPRRGGRRSGDRNAPIGARLPANPGAARARRAYPRRRGAGAERHQHAALARPRLTGEPKERLSAALVRAHAEGAPHGAEYKYYPDGFFEPYLARRRKVGWDLYGLLGIARGETARMQAQHARNLVFFDAPVGMIFTIDRRLEIGSWLDYGIFLGNVMTAARGRG